MGFDAHKLRDIESRTGTVVDLERGTTESQRRIGILKHHEASIPLCCLESQFHSISPMYRGAVSNELAPLAGEASILDVGITRWASNPYIRGAWSYARVNSSVKEQT